MFFKVMLECLGLEYVGDRSAFIVTENKNLGKVTTGVTTWP